MNIVDELNNEFSKQKLLYKVGQQPMAELEKYKQIARFYLGGKDFEADSSR